MSRAAETRLTFAGEERLFRLPIGRLRAVQEKTDCGPVELHNRFVAGGWRIDDVRETILQGLIGGGMNANDALKLMQTHFDDLPVAQFVDTAFDIMCATLFGVADETVGEKAAGAEKPKRRSRVAKSASPTSTKLGEP